MIETMWTMAMYLYTTLYLIYIVPVSTCLIYSHTNINNCGTITIMTHRDLFTACFEFFLYFIFFTFHLNTLSNNIIVFLSWYKNEES